MSEEQAVMLVCWAGADFAGHFQLVALDETHHGAINFLRFLKLLVEFPPRVSMMRGLNDVR
jgi:hypothetical protein